MDIEHELPGDQNARSDVQTGVYETHHPLVRDDIVMDLGAHLGFFTELAAPKCHRVYAFEPHPRNFSILKRSAGLLHNVEVFEYACADFHGPTLLWNNLGNTGGHSLFRNPQHGQAVEVMAIDIGDFMLGIHVIPTFVKIDTEGAEAMILRSLFHRLKDAMNLVKTDFAFEVHTADLYWECKKIIDYAGWKITPDVPHVGVCFANAR